MTAQKWRTVEGDNRSNATKSNISAVFGLGPAKAVSANFLFVTCIGFTKNNELSPARYQPCLSRGEKCSCSVFCRAYGMQPVRACPTSWHHLRPASFLSASSFLGWGTSSRAGLESLPPGRISCCPPPAPALASSVAGRMPAERQAAGWGAPSRPGRAEP